MIEKTLEEWFSQDWPIKYGEGAIRLERTKSRSLTPYKAYCSFAIYDARGIARFYGSFAEGDTATKAMARLWKNTIKEVGRLVKSGEFVTDEMKVFYNKYCTQG
jgi:hypothetical protein